MTPTPLKSADAVFRAIADPTRRRILQLLALQALSVGALCEHFAISQPAISQHMRVLRESGLVEARTQWRKRIYHITPGQLQQVLEWVKYFEHFWDDALDKLAKVVQDPENDDV